MQALAGHTLAKQITTLQYCEQCSNFSVFVDDDISVPKKKKAKKPTASSGMFVDEQFDNENGPNNSNPKAEWKLHVGERQGTKENDATPSVWTEHCVPPAKQARLAKAEAPAQRDFVIFQEDFDDAAPSSAEPRISRLRQLDFDADKLSSEGRMATML